MNLPSVKALGLKLLTFQLVNKPSLWVPSYGLCVKVPLRGNAPCYAVGEGESRQQILPVHLGAIQAGPRHKPGDSSHGPVSGYQHTLLPDSAQAKAGEVQDAR